MITEINQGDIYYNRNASTTKYLHIGEQKPSSPKRFYKLSSSKEAYVFKGNESAVTDAELITYINKNKMMFVVIIEGEEKANNLFDIDAL